MGERVREAAVDCPSENELTFDGELEETVAIGFFGRGISDPMFGQSQPLGVGGVQISLKNKNR